MRAHVFFVTECAATMYLFLWPRAFIDLVIPVRQLSFAACVLQRDDGGIIMEARAASPKKPLTRLFICPCERLHTQDPSFLFLEEAF